MTEVGQSLRLLPPNVILFGPPGVGKSEVGRLLAERLDRRFVDSDELIVGQAGAPIAEIFERQGEPAFRRLERQVCLELAREAGRVVALGGGALLEAETRAVLEDTGTVYCLHADRENLVRRLDRGDGRPLLSPDGGRSLSELLDKRASAYASFPNQVETTDRTAAEVAAILQQQVEEAAGWRLTVDQGSGYEVHVRPNLLSTAPRMLEAAGMTGRIAIVTDEHVLPLYGQELADLLEAPLVAVEAGEGSKRMSALERVQGELLAAGLDRGSCLLALGGGVVGDLAGMAAATYMRGIPWVNLPTSLLAMVDASLGGKVGVDLAGGKNLVGAFHPPALVAADLDTLDTLPAPEWRNGMAELVKAAIIGDARMFHWLEEGYEGPTAQWIRRAQAVKIGVVERDPQERGERAKLNAGHTVAHALEVLSGYTMPHGTAVSLGLVAESELAVRLDLASEAWPQRVARVLQRFELPTEHAGLVGKSVLAAMRSDKKNQSGELHFALPLAPGRVEHGLTAPPELVLEAVRSLEERR